MHRQKSCEVVLEAEVTQNKYKDVLFKKEKIAMGTAQIVNNDIIFLEDGDVSSILFNTEPQNTEGKSTRSLGYSEELIQIWINKIYLSEKEKTPISFQYWRKANDKFYFLSNVVSFSKRTSDDKVIFHYFIQDLTELKNDVTVIKNEKNNLAQNLHILEKKFNSAQNTIIENQNRYQTTFEIANVGITHISQNGQILMANKTMCKMLDCDSNSILNLNIADFCTINSIKDYTSAVNAIYSQQNTLQNIELKFKKTDGKIFWVEASLSAAITNNKVEYIVAIIKDINEKNKLEEELLNHKNRQQLMLSSAQISTWDWDLSTGNILNQYNAENVFGISHSTRQYFYSRVHPDDLKEMSEKIDSSVQNKTPFTVYYRYIRPDNNEIRWLESRGNVINNKILNTETLSGVTFDVTDKKEIDEQLHASRKQFQILAETIPNFIWKANKTGAILYFNKSWYDYTGLDENNSLGWNWIECIHPDDRELFLKSWQVYVKSGQQNGALEVRIQNSKHKYKWFLWQTKPITNHANKVLKWFGSFTDIDAQKKVLETTQSNLKAHDEFISIASHELKTPLTALKINLELLNGYINKSEIKMDRKIQKSVETSIKQANHLSFLIENLLNVSSIKNGLLKLTKEEINIANLIYECIEHNKESLKNAGCHVTSYLNTAVYCKVDSHKIEQVILNLLGNIIKYAPNSYVFIELKQIKNSIQIMVQDHGPGISKDKLSNIFNRFERGHNKKSISGMGLGLYICKQIVEAHKGRIWAESEPQQGTKIFVELPIN